MGVLADYCWKHDWGNLELCLEGEISSVWLFPFIRRRLGFLLLLLTFGWKWDVDVKVFGKVASSRSNHGKAACIRFSFLPGSPRLTLYSDACLSLHYYGLQGKLDKVPKGGKFWMFQTSFLAIFNSQFLQLFCASLGNGKSSKQWVVR